MSTTNSTRAVEQIDAGQANLELAESLREVATWLEMHAADIPEMWLGYLHFRNEHVRSEAARDELVAFARSLGDRASEECQLGTVRIIASFGEVRVSAGAPIADLRDEPPEPEPPKYEPIIPPRPADDEDFVAAVYATEDFPAVSPEEDEAWAERES